ncbi:hypothetical protein JFX47_27460, partial [Escherichia coli]|nr:hypothetical protein [Escherichia coli]
MKTNMGSTKNGAKVPHVRNRFTSMDIGMNSQILPDMLINFALINITDSGFAPIFPDTCYHLTHYWLAAVDIPVASDNPVHYADA